MEPPHGRAQYRDIANRAELAERIAHAAREEGGVEPIPGLHVYRMSQPTARVSGVVVPSFCVIAQGSKQVYLGERCYAYDPEHYLLVTVDLPVTSCILEASRDRPYLSLRMDLDVALVGLVIVEAGLSAPRGHGDAKAILVSAFDTDLLDATLRLVRLIDAPTQARVLAPLVKREIVFWLLLGDQGNRLRHLPLLGGHTHRIALAVDRLRKNFDQPVRIDRLARELGMSASGFHDHFKAVTDMSPLQFQKQLRLYEARRLMLSEHLDAASAAVRVGYNEASHFSRDYKKHFGTSPARDVERLRADLR